MSPGRTVIAALVLVAGAGPALANPSTLGPSLVSVHGTQLVVRKRLASGALAPPVPYTIRGINWSPASRGTSTTPVDPGNANVRRQEFGLWYRTHIALMKAMNVNTIRLFIGVTWAAGTNALAMPLN